MDLERRRTLAAAAHPVVLAAAALVLANDFVLRGRFPGWVTGKLSDVGWLVVAPVLVAAGSAAVGIRGARSLGILVAGVFYVVLQLWPPLGAAIHQGHVADAADLLVLPALLGAVWAWRTARPVPAHGLVALPVLAATLLADDYGGVRPASWPCGEDDMTWPPDRPFELVLGDSWWENPDSDAFLRGIRLTEAETGAEVPLVATSDWPIHVCARDGLRGDTAYTWEIGPWDCMPSNEEGTCASSLPTVRFRTLPGEGVAAAGPAACQALATPLDAATDRACSTGEYVPPEDTGDTGETGVDR